MRFNKEEQACIDSCDGVGEKIDMACRIAYMSGACDERWSLKSHIDGMQWLGRRVVTACLLAWFRKRARNSDVSMVSPQHTLRVDGPKI
jgi:hypothetical protein